MSRKKKRLSTSILLGMPVFFLLAGCGLSISLNSSPEPTTGPAISAKLSIESSADGSGVKISQVTLELGDSLDLFSISRNEGGAFLANTGVSWELSGSNGSLLIGAGSKSITFFASQVGSGSVTIRCLDGSCPDQIIEILVGVGVRPAPPTLALADGITNLNTYARQPAILVSVANDASIEKWCLSESQSLAPINSNQACNGGSGSINGWSTSRPTSMALSSGDGLKTVYLWVATSLGIVNSGSTSVSMILDETLPATPIAIPSDVLPGSVTQTFSSVIDITMSNDSDAVAWCLIEQPAASADPTAPLFTDGCFGAPPPTSLALTALGNWKFFAYTLDIAKNVSLVGTSTINHILNTAPVANSDNSVTSTGVAINISVLGNDTDVNLDVLSVVSKTDGSQGTVVIETNNTVTYTPNVGFVGFDSFTYNIEDGRGGTDSGSVTVRMVSPFTWMGSTNNNWSENSNWCGSISAGTCQLDGVAPASGDPSYFNDLCLDCDATVDLALNVGSVNLKSTYTGTLTQGVGNPITVTPNKWIQDSGTFAGSNADVTMFDHFEFTGGTFTAPSSNMILSSNNQKFNMSGGTFLHNNGTIELVASTGCTAIETVIDVPTTLTIYNLKTSMFDSGCNGPSQAGFAVETGDTLVVENSIDIDGGTTNRGVIDFQGDTLNFNCISANICSRAGGMVIILDEAKDQYYNVSPGGNPAKFFVDKPGFSVLPVTGEGFLTYGFTVNAGTFLAPPAKMTIVDDGFTVAAAGVFSHNNGHIEIVEYNPSSCIDRFNTIDVESPLNLNHFTINLYDPGCNGYSNARFLLHSGDTLNILGDFVFNNGYLDGGGTLNLFGNVELNCDGGMVNSGSCARGGDMVFNFVGGQLQTIDQAPESRFPANNVSIIKTGQELQFLTDVFFREPGQLVTLNAGTVNMNNNNLNIDGDFTIEFGAILNEGAGVLTVNGILTDNR